MKILVTTDWHLGNTFHGFDRQSEHEHFLHWLLGQIDDRQPDVLLVAGDVFDNGNPSAASQELYFSFLDQLTIRHPSLHTVIIAGNHDSAARLEAPRKMLERHSIQVRGIVQHTCDGKPDFESLLVPVYSIQHPGQKAWVLAVPYLREGDFGRGVPYGTGVRRFIQQFVDYVKQRRAASEPIILLAHLFASSAEIAENSSERIVIGGAEMVNMEAFDSDVSLALLGHLHRRQLIGGEERLRYSGSALPMSFTERNYQHGAEYIELGTDGEIQSVDFLSYTLQSPLLSIPSRPGRLTEITKMLGELPRMKDEPQQIPYLEVNVLLDIPAPELSVKIEKMLEGKAVRLCRISITYTVAESTDEAVQTMSVDDLLTRDPLEVIEKSYKSKYQCEMREELKELARRAVEAAKQEVL